MSTDQNTPTDAGSEGSAIAEPSKDVVPPSGGARAGGLRSEASEHAADAPRVDADAKEPAAPSQETRSAPEPGPSNEASAKVDEPSPSVEPQPETLDRPEPAARRAPEPTVASASQDDDDWGEQPGDDIGNRIPGQAPRDDIGNRRFEGRGPGRGGGGRAPDPRPAPRQDARPPRPAGPKPAHLPRAPGGPAFQPMAPKPQRPPVEAAAAEAPPADASTEPKPADVSDEAAGAPATDESRLATTAAPAEGETEIAKKRRRRRRRKGGAGAHPGSPEGAEGSDAGAEASGDDAASGGDGADASDAAGDDDGEDAGEHEGPAAGDQGASRRGERRKRGGHAPPPRERPAFSVGEEVFGKVSKVTEHAIWVDIAGKATGLFDIREIADAEPPVEGDQFIATVSSNGVRGGMLMLSRAPAHEEQAKEAIEAASTNGGLVEGFVTGAVKGGLEVDIEGVRAFAPASHVDLRHGADLGYMVGQRLEFHVAQYAKRGRDIVVSRKRMLEDESRKARAAALSNLQPGSLHKGIVRTVMQWGVFVALPDAGGVEGLVHMTEASHDRGAKLPELFKPGAEIEVKVIRVDERGKLWLSRKAAIPDPWEAVKLKYAVGTRHKGRVARLQPFGAFIELESGIDGLCHTADLTMKPIEHPNEVVKIGDEIEVVVASCDGTSHKIGLHAAPPPGEEAEPRQRIQPHKPLKVAVTQITEGGLVVRVLGVTGRSARAFIPAGHTGTARGTDLRKHFPIGTQLEAKVLEIDPRRGEAKLSIRALKEDAEKQAFQQYRAGVARDAKFGTFADLLNKKS